MKKIYVTLVVLLITATSLFLYFREGGLPVNKSDKTTKLFVIHSGEMVPQIAKNLENEGLIRNKVVFYWIVKKLNIDSNIQAGDFRLSPSMTSEEIAKNLTKGTLDMWVTIIEGLRKEEVAQIISQKFNIPEVEFTQQAQEGYLYPDTYLIPSQATSGAILAILQKNFDQKYTQALRDKARAKGLTTNQVLTLASIVQREALNNDKQGIANVLYKRYKSDYPLQVDVTIQYALGYQIKEKTWWRKEILFDDLQIDSPYNTYKNTTLPPGPICSPDVESIEAVVNANENSPYMFFLYDKNNVIHYARDNDEHQKNVEKYL